MPSLNTGVVIDHELPVAVTGLPSGVVPSKSCTEDPSSAVPDMVGELLFVVEDVVVMTGAAGGVVSTTLTVLVTCVAAFPEESFTLYVTV